MKKIIYAISLSVILMSCSMTSEELVSSLKNLGVEFEDNFTIITNDHGDNMHNIYDDIVVSLSGRDCRRICQAFLDDRYFRDTMAYGNLIVDQLGYINSYESVTYRAVNGASKETYNKERGRAYHYTTITVDTVKNTLRYYYRKE